MMLSTHFIIFMLFLTTCNGIKCIDETQVQLSISEIILNNIEAIFDDLKTSNSMMCQVYMEFDSIGQKFTIQFGQDVKFPRLRSVENAYIHTVTSIVSTNPEKEVYPASIKTKINLVCYSNDGCDCQLVLEHINWLIETNYRNLESIIRPLILVEDDKRNECTTGNGDNVEPCYSTACSWYSSMDTKQGEGKCENIESYMLPMLNLTTAITMFEKHKKEGEKEIKPIRAIFKHHSSMEFWCELNNCNNQNIGELVKEAISKHYDIWAMDNIHRSDR